MIFLWYFQEKRFHDLFSGEKQIKKVAILKSSFQLLGAKIYLLFISSALSADKVFRVIGCVFINLVRPLFVVWLGFNQVVVTGLRALKSFCFCRFLIGRVIVENFS